MTKKISDWLPGSTESRESLDRASSLLAGGKLDEAVTILSQLHRDFLSTAQTHEYGTKDETSLAFSKDLFLKLAEAHNLVLKRQGKDISLFDKRRKMNPSELIGTIKRSKNPPKPLVAFRLGEEYHRRLTELRQHRRR